MRLLSFLGSSERAAVAPRAFPCAGVRAEALRSTGCSDGRSTRRDANQCVVAFFRTINGVAYPSLSVPHAFDCFISRAALRVFHRLAIVCHPESGESREDRRIRGSRCDWKVIGWISRVNRSRKCDSWTRGNYSTMIRAYVRARRAYTRRGAARRSRQRRAKRKERKLIRPTRAFSASTRDVAPT